MVREAVRYYSDYIDAEPDKFMMDQYVSTFIHVCQTAADWINCARQDLVLVLNATTATNAVLRSFKWEKGDGILFFNTIYGGAYQTVRFVTNYCGLNEYIVNIDYPIAHADLIRKFEDAIKAYKPRMAIFDATSSVPGVTVPWADLCNVCSRHDVISFVDAAHCPEPIDISASKPDFFVTNLHKWKYAQRPVALFYVARHMQDTINSFPISHGYRDKKSVEGVFIFDPSGGRLTDFEREFNFVGTLDQSKFCAIPDAINFIKWMGGDKVVFEYSNKLARDGGRIVANKLNSEVLGDEFVGVMTNVELPGVAAEDNDRQRELEKIFLYKHNTSIKIFAHAGKTWVRLSAPVYLEISDFERAGDLFKKELGIP